MSDDIPSDPDLENVLDLLGESVMESIRTSVPGVIVSYDASRQSASVRLLNKNAHVDENGDRVVKSNPELHDVVVSFLGPPRGRLTWPVAAGDLCLVKFCSSSIARVKLTGQETDPGDDRKHHISDATAFVGAFHRLLAPGTDAPTDAVVVHLDGVKFKVGSSGAVEKAVLGTTYRSAEDSLFTAMETCLVALSTAIATLATAAPVLTGTAPQQAAFVAAVTAAAAAATSLATAVSAFGTGASNYLSQKMTLE